MAVIGIRHEDKSVWERRSPLVPGDVADLVQNHGVDLHVQSSDTRCFPDEEYRRAGAVLTDDGRRR
jgi:alpha-aminoadipic semialdehyde synthase